LTDKGDVKLADFGLSNVVRPEPGFHSPASQTPTSNTLQTQCGSPHVCFEIILTIFFHLSHLIEMFDDHSMQHQSY
jgi:hypothetical protein